jgi:hypothetical protein
MGSRLRVFLTREQDKTMHEPENGRCTPEGERQSRSD